MTFVVVSTASSLAARTSHHSSADPIDKLLPVGIVVLVGLILAAINASKKSKPISPEQLAQLQAEAMAFFDKLEGGTITPPSTPISLRSDETALLNEPSKLNEARATRVYAGGGTRVQGIYVGGGQSSSFQTLKELDSGTLTLTTQRLVFTGSLESRVVKLSDIVSVQAMADAIEVSVASRAKRQVYVVRNPIIWGALLRNFISSTPIALTHVVPEKPQPSPVRQTSAARPAVLTSEPAPVRPTRVSRRFVVWISVVLALLSAIFFSVYTGRRANKGGEFSTTTPPPISSTLDTRVDSSSSVTVAPIRPAVNPAADTRALPLQHSLPTAGEFVVLTAPVMLRNSRGKEVKQLSVGKRLRLVRRSGNQLVINYVDQEYTIPAAATQPAR